MMNLMAAIKVATFLMVINGFSCDGVHDLCVYRIAQPHTVIMSACDVEYDGSDQTASIYKETKFKGWVIKTPIFSKMCHAA